MKKILLLLLLCPLMAMAEYFPGTVTMNDGSERTGYMEEPGAEDVKKLKFRQTKDGDTEKIFIDDVKSITFTKKDKNTVTYLTLKLAEPKAFYKGYKIADKKSWVRIEKAGKINIVSAYFIGSGGRGYCYYLHKPLEDYCYYVTTFYDGLNFAVGEFKAIQAYTGMIFKDDCPKLGPSLTKEDYKKKGLDLIVQNYTQLCGERN